MASTYSFDVVSRVDVAEVQNAVTQTAKVVQTRFDFHGTSAAIEWDARAQTITLIADSDQQVRSLLGLTQERLAKRGVPLRALEVGTPAPAAGGTRRQVIGLRQGIPADTAKALGRALRDRKIRVTSQVQGDQLRVTGAKKDDLQAAIAALRETDFGIELQFVNYR